MWDILDILFALFNENTLHWSVKFAQILEHVFSMIKIFFDRLGCVKYIRDISQWKRILTDWIIETHEIHSFNGWCNITNLAAWSY